MANFLQSLADPKALCRVVATTEKYQQQRDRAAALLHDALQYYEGYQQMKPVLFATGLGLMALSGWLWWTRGMSKGARGNRIPEAHVLYPLGTVTGAVMAWFTRPAELFPETVPQPPPPGQPAAPVVVVTEPGQAPVAVAPAPQVPATFLNRLDNRVAQLLAQDPAFADKVFARVKQVPDLASLYKELPEEGRVLIDCGRAKRLF